MSCNIYLEFKGANFYLFIKTEVIIYIKNLKSYKNYKYLFTNAKYEL